MKQFIFIAMSLLIWQGCSTPEITATGKEIPRVPSSVFSAVDCKASGMASKIKTGESIVKTKTVSFPFTTLETFKDIWKVWDQSEQQALNGSKGALLMQAIANHYGLFMDPTVATTDDSLPMGLTLTTGSDGKHNINVNCYACHASMINNNLIIGAGNPKFDFNSLLLDTLRQAAVATNKPINSFADLLKPVPTGLIAGRMNAEQVISTVAAAWRAKNMDLVEPSPSALNLALTTPQADVDPQTWWNAKNKKNFMWDGQSGSDSELRNADFLSNVTAIPGLGVFGYSGEELRGRRGDLHSLYAYSMCTETPKALAPQYQNIIGDINPDLAADGKKIYGPNCTGCHGAYGEHGELIWYPDVFTPIGGLKTDPVRYEAASEFLLDFYRGFPSETDDANGNLSGHASVAKQEGYQAPPLSGIWASAPYFHNGGVPTLEDVLNEGQRPAVWKIVDDPNDMYDRKRVGLKVERLTKVPDGLSEWQSRKYYNSQLSGAKVGGHSYGYRLTETQKEALLEYLKTL